VNRGTSWGPRAIARRIRRGKPFDAWLDLEWEEDALARQLVDEEPDGMTLDAIGEHLDLTRERVRQIEQDALRKLRDSDLGNVVVVLDGWSFAVLRCPDCDSQFVRLNGRQELCASCSRRRRAATPKGRSRDHAWAPTPAMERRRRRLADARLAAAEVRRMIGSERIAHKQKSALVGDDGIALRVRVR
jgi:hypothetical protein